MTVIVTTFAVAAAAALLLNPDEEQYRPGEAVDGLTSTLDRDARVAGATAADFVDIASEAGLAFDQMSGTRSSQLPEDMGSGAAWGDYDNDGLPDLYLVAVSEPLTATSAEVAASPNTSRLFHNEGGGRFTDVTADLGAGVRGVGQAAAFGDVDGDGDLDLVVTTYGPIHLLINEQADGFRNASSEWGLADHLGFWSGATFFDYDRDGRLDLYVCGYVRYRNDEKQRQAVRQYAAVVPYSLNPSSFAPERNLLFHNLANARFEEVAESLGVDNPNGRSLSAAAVDLDDDGWPEIYVANDISDNMLYRSLGDGTFEDQSLRALVADYRGAMGLAVGDWDNDTDLDLFVTHWVAQENALYVNTRAETSLAPGAKALVFADAADMHGLGQPSIPFVGWGTSFLDYDLDGRLDLFVANGHTVPLRDDPTKLQPMRSMLYWNAGAMEGFFDVAGGNPVLAAPIVARGAASADFDRDGDVDIVINVQSGAPKLLRNDTKRLGHWLTVRLRGTRSNSFAVGARLTIEAGGVTQTRELGSQSSYLSQNVVGEETFGLGKATVIDRLTVRWPAGDTVEAGPFDVDQMIDWREGDEPVSASP